MQNNLLFKCLKWLFTACILLSLSVCFGQNKSSSDAEIMRNAKYISGNSCANDLSKAYNLSINKWRDSVSYKICDYPKLVDSATTERLIKKAIQLIRKNTGLNIKQAFDSAFILIKHDYLDGIGGTLGISEFPPYAHNKQPITVLIDKFDVQAKDSFFLFDPFTIYLHELGHAFGLEHSDSRDAVMFSRYTSSKSDFGLDDKIAIRQKYENRAAFTHGKHRYVWVTDEKKQVNRYFNQTEFYTKCGSGGHYLDSALIKSITDIRVKYGCAIEILSSYRDAECNEKTNGAVRSQHLINNALDFKFVGKNAASATSAYKSDIAKRRIEYLLKSGIAGFGFYKTGSFHIDTRDSFGKNQLGLYRFDVWTSWSRGGLSDDNPENDIFE